MFKVFTKKEKVDKDIYFRLIQNDNTNVITLIACDRNGERMSQGDILNISSKGIHLCESVSSQLGLPIANNKIKLY